MAADALGPVRFRITGKRTAEFRADKIEVGTRSNCALTLNDPVAAELHCLFTWKSGAFWIEDGRSVTGTYRNGVPVHEPELVASGDHVVVGVSRLVLAISGEGDAACLEITPDEASFFYKAKDRKEFKSDPDEWVRSEVRFGRIPIVQTLSWISVLGMVVFAVLIFATRRGERWLEPGSLSGTHGALFAMNPGDLAVGANFGAARALAERDGCSVCHSSLAGPKVENCATCHADLLESAHPFRATAGAALDGAACLACHAGHQGQSKAEVLAAARVVARSEGSCTSCHQDAVPKSVSRPMASTAKLPHKDVPLVYDDFSHAAHASAPWNIACSRCHTPSTGSNAGEPHAEREFGVVSYDVCASCHVAKLLHAANSELVSPSMAKALKSSPKGLVVQLEQHGSAPPDTCLECHADVHTAALKPAEAERYTWRHEISPRDHRPATPSASEACAACHSDMSTLSERGPARTAAFVHALHVSTLDPNPAELPRVLLECAHCHAGTRDSTALGSQGSSKPPATLEACAKCHRDDKGAALVRSSSRGERVTDPRREFPHNRHVTIAGGCLACHEFDAASDGKPDAARPDARLKKGADDCAACHAEHKNIAGGACAVCHPWKSDSTRALLAAAPQSHSWPQMQFQHFAGGHGELTRADKCDTCHTDMNKAATIRAVTMPTGANDICRKCHVENRTWFHWR